eukprot:1143634-Pelagomonas_calceolata.AAC.10
MPNAVRKRKRKRKKEKGKATQAAHTSSIVLRKGRPPPPQGLELGTPRRLEEDEHSTRLCILTQRSPIHPSGLLARVHSQMLYSGSLIASNKEKKKKRNCIGTGNSPYIN